MGRSFDAMTDLADLTLEELRAALAEDIADAAVFDGWSMAAADTVAAVRGLDPALVRTAFADGAMAMITAWIASVDRRMEAALAPADLAALSIRERIRRLVQFRLDAIAGLEEALRRAMAIMAMPGNVAAAARLGWHSADLMWRLAGDVATDYNHYTKRVTLLGIYTATLAVFADDTSEDKAETRAFLDRRIEGVMRFEKAKAKLFRADGEHFSLARLAGRLRYPAT
jgi:ubiquinone biosynthesis protein COQ9